MSQNLLAIVSFFLGYLWSLFTSGQSVGQQGRITNQIIHFQGKTILLHHWATLAVFLIILLVVQARFKLLPQYLFICIVGICLGSFLHGLTYNDWSKFIQNP